MLSINDTIYCRDHTIEEFKNSDKYKGPKKNDSSDLTTTCSICNKSISVNDVALTFKDGRMCDDCAKKYNLLEQDGFPTAKAMKYCNSHTVDDFKNWIKASTELGATQSQNESLLKFKISRHLYPTLRELSTRKWKVISLKRKSIHSFIM